MIKLKEYLYEIKIIGISAVITTIMVVAAGIILYEKIPKQQGVQETGSISCVNNYYITGIDGNISKHAYILVDRDTNIMYLAIDTLQNGEVIATSQSELYGKNQTLMTYKEYLNKDEEKFKADSLNNKIQTIKPVEPGEKAEGNTNAK